MLNQTGMVTEGWGGAKPKKGKRKSSTNGEVGVSLRRQNGKHYEPKSKS